MLYADNACIVSRSPRGLELMVEVFVEGFNVFDLTILEDKAETIWMPITRAPATVPRDDRDDLFQHKTGGNGDPSGSGIGAETRVGTAMKRGERELVNPPHQVKNRVEEQVLSFRTRYHSCRQEVALAGSQLRRAQDPAPVRRRRIEGRAGPQRREEGTGDDGNRGEGGGWERERE